jgi:hypothetical protein
MTAQDFVGAAGDTHRRRTEQHLLELAARLFLVTAGGDTGRAPQIHRIACNVLRIAPRDQLADGIFRSRSLALDSDEIAR